MADKIPFNAILDFLLNGKGRPQGRFDPHDADVDSAVTALESGLESKHIADHAIGAEQLKSFRLLPFAGVDGSGETPDLTCTLTGALAGDTVAAVIATADFSDQRSKFESVISVAAAIEQTSLTDLSAKTYLALLISA